MTVNKITVMPQADSKTAPAAMELGVTSVPEVASNQQPTGRSSCHSFLNLFCQRVNLGGLGKLVDVEYGWKMRMVWTVSILGMGAFGLYQTAEQIKKLASKPIRVSINISHHRQIDFPMVTLCNINLVSKRKSDLGNITQFVEAILYNQAGVDFSVSNWTGWDWDDFYKTYGHLREETILACCWKQNCSACSPNDFEDVITDMGWCHRFKGSRFTGTGRPLMVDSAGTEYALDILLLAHVDEYMGGRFGPGSGFAITVGDEKEPTSLKQSGVPVAPGMHTHVALKQTRLRKIPAPYGTCGEKTLKYYPKYSHSGCHMECVTDYVIQHCGCKDAYLPGNHRICTPGDLYQCTIGTLARFAQDSNNTCVSECPEQCVTKTFEMYVSAVPLSEWFFKNMAEEYYLNLDFLRKNLLVVTVYYKTMTVEETSQSEAYTAIDMICDIGGSFGLTLGASILTALDIVDFFVYFFITRRPVVHAEGTQ